MQEEWKNIIIEHNGAIYDFTGKFQISNKGRIRSLDRYVKNNYSKRFVEGKILKPWGKEGGYLSYSFYIDKKSIQFSIHRLVANAFIPNPNNHPIINHKDENPSNNNADNLEWCTYKYNNDYGTRKLKCMIKQGRKINQYNLQGGLVKQWNSIREIGRDLGIDHTIINYCCNNKDKVSHGYIWKYADEE